MGFRANAPYFLNKVAIRLAILNTDPELLDPDFEEPVDTKSYTEVFFQGQMRMRIEDKLQENVGGDVPQADGHVFFKRAELELAGLLFKKGDKITGIANRTGGYDDVNYEFVHIRGHSEHLGGKPIWYKCFFVDDRTERQPIPRGTVG